MEAMPLTAQADSRTAIGAMPVTFENPWLPLG